MNIVEQHAKSLVGVNVQSALLTARWGRWTGLRVHAVVVAVVASTLYLDNPSWTLMIGGALVAPIFLIIGLSEARKDSVMVQPIVLLFLLVRDEVWVFLRFTWHQWCMEEIGSIFPSPWCRLLTWQLADVVNLVGSLVSMPDCKLCVHSAPERRGQRLRGSFRCGGSLCSGWRARSISGRRHCSGSSGRQQSPFNGPV